MRAGTLVLFTDQPERRSDLIKALGTVAICCPRDAAAVTDAGDCVGFVCDLDLETPKPLGGLHALIAEMPNLPRLFLLRDKGVSSLAAARSLGASLCLPDDTPAAMVAAALRTSLDGVAPPPPGAERPAESRIAGPRAAIVVQAADRAGAVLAEFLDSVRAGAVDAGKVDAGLDPILNAVGEVGLGAWLDTVRAYDDATYQHCLLVAGLAGTFGIHLGFGIRDREQLVRAALVHDVGKARIPLTILKKPGPLDPVERAVMRTHAALGHVILVEAGGFDDSLLSVVRHHHEFLDGTGYPDGLSGKEIPDLVRLITICDIYAALAERRPYRPPLPTGEALAVLRSMEGKLDMGFVRSFERAITRA